MKKFAILASAMLAMPSAAFAQDLEASCIEYQQANGGDPAGCSCLASYASSNPSIADELLAQQGPIDRYSLSAAAQAAIEDCFPQ